MKKKNQVWLLNGLLAAGIAAMALTGCGSAKEAAPQTQEQAKTQEQAQTEQQAQEQQAQTAQAILELAASLDQQPQDQQPLEQQPQDQQLPEQQ